MESGEVMPRWTPSRIIAAKDLSGEALLTYIGSGDLKGHKATRAKAAHGKTIADALKMQCTNAKGSLQPYKKADIIYDIKMGLLSFKGLSCPKEEANNIPNPEEWKRVLEGFSAHNAAKLEEELLPSFDGFGAYRNPFSSQADESWRTTSNWYACHCLISVQPG